MNRRTFARRLFALVCRIDSIDGCNAVLRVFLRGSSGSLDAFLDALLANRPVAFLVTLVMIERGRGDTNPIQF